MLTIKPIQEKNEQEAACARCGIVYDAASMAYGADEDGVFVGMSQFTFEKDAGYIQNIALREGLEDFEASFLIARATMNFIDLCGIHQTFCSPDAAPDRIIKAVGFKLREDGRLWADLTHMFGGCGGEGHNH